MSYPAPEFAVSIPRVIVTHYHQSHVCKVRVTEMVLLLSHISILKMIWLRVFLISLLDLAPI